jgi:hypothetical protein
VKKRDKENFEKMFLILQLYTGRKTISGPGNTAPPPLVAARQLSLYLRGGPQIKFLTAKKTLKSSFLKKYVKFKKVPDAFLYKFKFKNMVPFL